MSQDTWKWKAETKVIVSVFHWNTFELLFIFSFPFSKPLCFILPDYSVQEPTTICLIDSYCFHIPITWKGNVKDPLQLRKHLLFHQLWPIGSIQLLEGRNILHRKLSLQGNIDCSKTDCGWWINGLNIFTIIKSIVFDNSVLVKSNSMFDYTFNEKFLKSIYRNSIQSLGFQKNASLIIVVQILSYLLLVVIKQVLGSDL